MCCALRHALCALSSSRGAAGGQGSSRRFHPTAGCPTPNNPDPLAKAFKQGLRELGYIEGKNVIVEHRYAGGTSDRLPVLVNELVQSKVDVIVAASIQVIRVLKRATKTIPIVIVTQLDPVAEKLVDSLAQPGGNITGLTRLTTELSRKRLEILKEAIPGILLIGLIDGSTDPLSSVKDYEPAARAMNITIQPINLPGPKPDFRAAFQAAARGGVNGVIVSRDAVTASYSKQIAEQAVQHRLPSMNEDRPYVEAGGLMSYAANDAEHGPQRMSIRS
jgi:putative ABC transport system substrate-binding protein